MSTSGSDFNKARDKASDSMSSAGEALEHAKAAGQKSGASAMDRASNMAQQAASTVSEKSREMANQAGQQADRAAANLGTQISSAADNLRSRLPEEGMFRDAGERVASAIESSGHYLEEHQFSGSMEELTELVKKYPLQSLAIGVGIGFLFARVFTSSRGA